MSPAPLRSRVNEARVFFTSAETTGTCANRLAGQFGRLYLRHRVILGDTSTWGLYASNVRWRRQFMTDVYFLDYDLPGDPPRAGFDYNVETGAGKVVVSSAPVRVPSFTERNRNFRMDMVLAREPNDALYRFENVPIRPANPSIARFVGSQPDLEIRWAIHEHFLIVLGGWQTTEP